VSLPRAPISGLMIAVAMIAADIAALRATLPAIPNPGLVVMIVVLEVGLPFTVVRRGTRRAFWLGFEVFGWAYLLACLTLDRPIWRMLRAAYETYVLGATLGGQGERWRFIGLAGGLQSLSALAAALVGGLLARRAAGGRD